MRKGKLKTEGQQHTPFGWNSHSWVSHKAASILKQKPQGKDVPPSACNLSASGLIHGHILWFLRSKSRTFHKGMTEREWLRLIYTLSQ